ncbi:hypothetical protein A3Q56_02449 [Intoshia linei]|uniref:Uncharacterized protein n=1 Tax=Intoshia linei TaxID=1819745 RepID=A0A177B6N7_9BILA|nr:hypothetical protein A3Q56_02449 [Intoshia linei]
MITPLPVAAPIENVYPPGIQNIPPLESYQPVQQNPILTTNPVQTITPILNPDEAISTPITHDYDSKMASVQPMGSVQPVYNQAVQPMPGQTTVIVQNNSRPSNYLALAIFVTICCNILFGIIAIIFSVMSSSAADENNIEDAKSKGKISMYISIVGIVISIVVAIILIVYFVYVTTMFVGNIGNLTETAMSDLYNNIDTDAILNGYSNMDSTQLLNDPMKMLSQHPPPPY